MHYYWLHAQGFTPISLSCHVVTSLGSRVISVWKWHTFPKTQTKARTPLIRLKKWMWVWPMNIYHKTCVCLNMKLFNSCFIKLNNYSSTKYVTLAGIQYLPLHVVFIHICYCCAAWLGVSWVPGHVRSQTEPAAPRSAPRLGGTARQPWKNLLRQPWE